MDIWTYISKDSVNRANIFKSKLKNKIKNLSNNPYKFRKSFYYNDNNVRDLIYKGYTVPYLIDTSRNVIVILDIFKWVNR